MRTNGLHWFILILLVAFSLCTQQPQDWVRMEFSSRPLPAAAVLGVTSTEWTGESLVVKANVNINCHETIENGSYELRYGELYLSFVSEKCEACEECTSVHELTYNIKDIPPGNYEVHLQRIM